MTETLYYADDGTLATLPGMAKINAKLRGNYCARQARQTPGIPTHNVVSRRLPGPANADGMIRFGKFCIACQAHV